MKEKRYARLRDEQGKIQIRRESPRAGGPRHLTGVHVLSGSAVVYDSIRQTPVSSYPLQRCYASSRGGRTPWRRLERLKRRLVNTLSGTSSSATTAQRCSDIRMEERNICVCGVWRFLCFLLSFTSRSDKISVEVWCQALDAGDTSV